MNESLKLCYEECLNLNNLLISEWWWTTNQSLNIISNLLLNFNYVLIDNFLLNSEIEIIFNEVNLLLFFHSFDFLLIDFKFIF